MTPTIQTLRPKSGLRASPTFSGIGMHPGYVKRRIETKRECGKCLRALICRSPFTKSHMIIQGDPSALILNQTKIIRVIPLLPSPQVTRSMNHSIVHPSRIHFPQKNRPQIFHETFSEISRSVVFWVNKAFARKTKVDHEIYVIL